MKKVNHIQLFISCPSDIQDEQNSIRLIIDEINKSTGRNNNFLLEALNWTTDTYTQIATDAQQVINNQLEERYDILIGILWQKIGTPTKRDKSGTIEEINRAIETGKQLLIYFNTKAPVSLNDIKLEDLSKINEFKKELSQKGVLYKEYTDIKTFESYFRIHLNNLVNDYFHSSSKEEKTEVINESGSTKYQDVVNILNQVEQNHENPELEFDVFQIIEQLIHNLDSIASSMNVMTIATNELTDHMVKRTDELQTYSHIKDNRLRLKKLETIANLLADELGTFNNKIRAELPIFSENYLPIGPNYVKISQYAKKFQIEETETIKSSLIEYRDSIVSAVKQSASLLKSIMDWPPATPKLNRAKRETEVVLKEITKEMLEGLQLIDEALK